MTDPTTLMKLPWEPDRCTGDRMEDQHVVVWTLLTPAERIVVALAHMLNETVMRTDGNEDPYPETPEERVASRWMKVAEELARHACGDSAIGPDYYEVALDKARTASLKLGFPSFIEKYAPEQVT